MSKNMLITEKPSVAMEFAKVISKILSLIIHIEFQPYDVSILFKVLISLKLFLISQNFIYLLEVIWYVYNKYR